MGIETKVEYEGRDIMGIRYKGQVYLPLREAAELIDVPYRTLLRWIRRVSSPILIEAIRDPLNRHLYVSKGTIERLKPENRIIPINYD